MNRFLLISLLLFCPFAVLGQDVFVPNYEEQQVGFYTLPDPLQPPKGKRITTVGQWETQHAYWLDQFSEHVYGKTPTDSVRLRYETCSIKTNALGGKAIRKQISIHLENYPDLPPIELVLYIPKRADSLLKQAPVFLGLNFCGNHCISPEFDLPLSDRWVANVVGDMTELNSHGEPRASVKSRGMQARRWPLDTILARGYALATAYYGDIEPDHVNGWKAGIRSVLGDTAKADNWGAIGAWAWGMSRILDYLETDSLVNAKKVIAFGHSRIAKAALWAAAQDQRFAGIVANEAGEGGTALARRNYGETIGRINSAFPHWFAPQYKTYSNDVQALPVDQHILLSLLAPRPLYVASAQDDRWSDPNGEFLGAKGAEPVYALYGKQGLGATSLPSVNTSIGSTISYHIRTGVHDVTDFDWWQYLQFADDFVR
jgi:hypothetical protein